MTWLDDNPTDGLGGYRLLTGDTMTVTAAVSNTSETPNTYRIYLHLNDTDGSINLEPGTTYTFDEVEATCHATEDRRRSTSRLPRRRALRYMRPSRWAIPTTNLMVAV